LEQINNELEHFLSSQEREGINRIIHIFLLQNSVQPITEH